MKAAVMHGFGGPEVMSYEDVPDPEPGPGDVVVQVHAVSINRTLDLVVRDGKYPQPVNLPHILGVDPAGVVTAIGDGVTKAKVGDRVALGSRVMRLPGKNSKPAATPNWMMLGVTIWGGYAEYVVVPEENCAPIPDGLGIHEACVVLRHFPMAFSLVRDKAKLQPDQTILVMGASGGLGSAIVQLAKALGATVIAAAGADERVRAAVDLGADHGINYRSDDLEQAVMAATDGAGVHVVAENIGDPDLFPAALNTLVFDGNMVTAGGHAGGIVPLDVNRLYQRRITIHGTTISHQEDWVSSLEMAAEGKIRPIIDRVMKLSEAAEAQAYVADRDGVGKVVLDPTLG